jgi:hypothetical protein
MTYACIDPSKPPVSKHPLSEKRSRGMSSGPASTDAAQAPLFLPSTGGTACVCQGAIVYLKEGNKILREKPGTKP